MIMLIVGLLFWLHFRRLREKMFEESINQKQEERIKP